MKKLLAIIILCLLSCNVSFAKIWDFKCTSYFIQVVAKDPYNYTEDWNSKYMMHLRLDTSKKIFIIYDDLNEDSDDVIKIDKITDNQYRHGDIFLEGSKEFYFFNRYTGVFVQKTQNHTGKKKGTDWYQCENTKQLY